MSAATPEQVAAVRGLVSALQHLPANELVRLVREARKALPRARKRPPPRPAPYVLVGHRTGTLTVTRWLGRGQWLCVCDCGEERTASSNALLMFAVKSCPTCSLRSARVRILAHFEEIVARYYSDGWSLDACAAFAETTGTTLARVFREHHLPTRPRGRLPSTGCAS